MTAASVATAYITGLGRFLPGEPVSNDQIEDRLGRIGGRPSRARSRVLKQNGIIRRHYALDEHQRSRFRVSEMAANAVRDALSADRLPLGAVDFLAAATTQGDLLVPGFASMVHGELRTGPLEIATLHGVCASGMMALKNAVLQVCAGGKRAAVACAAEMPSRVFKASRFSLEDGEALPFDTEFLRWMLSDGAGAAVVRPEPSPAAVSLRVDWIHLSSHAGENELCMFAGANKAEGGALGQGWLDFPSVEAALREGAVHLKQDIRLLDRVVQLGVAGFFELVDRGELDPRAIDWLVVHHSSEFFKERIFELLAKGGLHLPEERWFSNLTTVGNVGAASLFVLLEELVRTKPLRDGQKILVMIPESGRFIRSYAHLTVVGGAEGKRPVEPGLLPPSAAPTLVLPANQRMEQLVRGLTRAWVQFEQRLGNVPVVRAINDGTLTLSGYRTLLLNLRQQVIEGSRWIARAASSVSPARDELRALFLLHARDEQADFRMLERDFVACGGEEASIRGGEKNVGAEALSAWMFHRGSQPDPFDLLGAMFIIEGLGNRLAGRWAERIQEQLGLTSAQVSFLAYHGKNDETHFHKLERALELISPDEPTVERIVKTAQVTARLYALQLEELAP